MDTRRAPAGRAATLLYAATALLWTAPVWAEPTTRVVGRAEGEFRDHLWVAWLVATRVGDDHALPVQFPQARFPIDLHLYPLDPLTHLVVTPLSALVGVVPAFAVLTTGLLALAGIGGRALARAVGAAPGAAVIAGLLVQAGPPVLGSYADTQTEGMGVGWPLLTLATLVAPGPWTTKRAVTLGALGAATAWSTPYQAHALLLVGAPLVGVLLWRSAVPIRALVIAGALALPAAGVAAAGLWAAEAQAGGQLFSRGTGDGDWPPRTMADSAVVAPALMQASTISPLPVAPWPREPRYVPPSTGPRRWAGVVLPALALLGAAKDRRARWLLAGAALYGALALGSARDWAFTALDGARVPLPFDLWYRWFPLGHLAWKPAQYAVPAWCFAAAAAAFVPGRWLAVGAGLAAVELQLRGPTPAPLPAMALAPLPAYSWLAAQAQRDVTEEPGVVEFPCRARSRGGVDALPFDVLQGQMFHRHPIGETFGRGENPPHQALLDGLAEAVGWEVGRAPPLPDAWRGAQKSGFGFLLVHEGLLTEAERRMLMTRLAPLAADSRAFADGTVLWSIPPLPGAPP